MPKSPIASFAQEKREQGQYGDDAGCDPNPGWRFVGAARAAYDEVTDLAALGARAGGEADSDIKVSHASPPNRRDEHGRKRNHSDDQAPNQPGHEGLKLLAAVVAAEDCRRCCRRLGRRRRTAAAAAAEQ